MSSHLSAPVEDLVPVTLSDSTDIAAGCRANVRVSGPVAELMTRSIDPLDADGKLKSIFDRTWAIDIFGLSWQEADPVSNFPAGYRDPANTVSYCDPADLKSPTNTWA